MVILAVILVFVIIQRLHDHRRVNVRHGGPDSARYRNSRGMENDTVYRKGGFLRQKGGYNGGFGSSQNTGSHGGFGNTK